MKHIIKAGFRSVCLRMRCFAKDVVKKQQPSQAQQMDSCSVNTGYDDGQSPAQSEQPVFSPPRGSARSKALKSPTNWPVKSKKLPAVVTLVLAKAVHSRHTDQPSTTPSEESRNGTSAPSVLDVQVKIINALSAALAHIPYAVCGSAALALWGRDYGVRPAGSRSDGGGCAAAAGSHRQTVCEFGAADGASVVAAAGSQTAAEVDGQGLAQPVCVSIVAAQSSMRVITSWALAKGIVLQSVQPCVLGVSVATCLGVGVFPVRVCGLDDDSFARLQTVCLQRRDPACRPCVRILALNALANLAALDYAHSFEAVRSPALRDVIAQDILWILRRMACSGSGRVASRATRLTLETAPALLDPLFHHAFRAAYPEAEALFANAGLAFPARDGRVSAEGPSLRARGTPAASSPPARQ